MEAIARQHDEELKFRVMVIDDNPQDIKSYVSGLSDCFYTSFAKDTKSAWDLLNRSPLPDAIILDLMDPNDSGFDFCQRVKDSPYTNDIPIIFLSDAKDNHLRLKAFEVGGSDYVQKPADMIELTARVKGHAGTCRRTKTLESLIYIDPLTHLPNASKFNELITQEWSRCARYWHHLSLLLIHFNHMEAFKAHFGRNDYYDLIASIAEDLTGIGARPGDLFAYLENNTFGLLLSDCSLEGARLKAAQINTKFADPNFAINTHEGDLGISCTVAISVAAPAGGGDPKQLYQTCDNLLFKAKKENRHGTIELGRIIGVDEIDSY